MIIDTHAHLDFLDFAEDLDAVLARAVDAGVTRFVSIGTSLESSRRAVALAEKNPRIFAVVGVHPNAAEEAAQDFLDELRVLAKNPRVVAIGETGLDYYRLPSRQMSDLAAGEIRDAAHKKTQARIFTEQLALAAELGLNVVVHEREAFADTIDLLRPFTGRLRAVFHCFGKSPAHAAEVFALGHLVSFTGIVTFKNAPEAQATAASAPGDRFMVETDCPFLAPVPHRGKRAEPAHTRLVAEHLARLRGVSLETIAAQTSQTAEEFFRLSGAS